MSEARVVKDSVNACLFPKAIMASALFREFHFFSTYKNSSNKSSKALFEKLYKSSLQERVRQEL